MKNKFGIKQFILPICVTGVLIFMIPEMASVGITGDDKNGYAVQIHLIKPLPENNSIPEKINDVPVHIDVDLIVSSEGFETSSNLSNKSETTIQSYSSHGFQELRNEAEQQSQRQDIRKLICPALKSVSDDVNEIAKVIVPLLAGAALGGTLIIPLNPILFGWIALIIARSGIATICTE